MNVLSYVGLGPLMMYVMGLEAAKSLLQPVSDAQPDSRLRAMATVTKTGKKVFGIHFSRAALGPLWPHNTLPSPHTTVLTAG